MTYEKVKAIAKEKYGKELTDEQAVQYAEKYGKLSDDELNNVSGGCDFEGESERPCPHCGNNDCTIYQTYTQCNTCGKTFW